VDVNTGGLDQAGLDDAGLDDDGLDLSPRTGPGSASMPPRRKRHWAAYAVLGAVLVVGGIVVSKFLTQSLDYYCNVDEIGVKSNCGADQRLRVQGVVDEGSKREDGSVTLFTISFNGKTLPVRYQGQPGGLFQECIPVVVHGRLVDGVFQGNEVEVKHSSDYVKANKDRLAESQTEADACSQKPA
jgi:cytochrome c-type biogenesis protein CcmE